MNGPNAAASIAPTLIRHWTYSVCGVCSVKAKSNAKSDVEDAKKLGYASLALSVAGIIVTGITSMFVLGLVLSRRYDYSSYRHCSGYGCYYSD